MSDVTWRSWVDGPKGCAATIMRGAIDYGVTLTVLNHDKRWFNETLTFEVRGTEKRVASFSHAIWANKL